MSGEIDLSELQLLPQWAKEPLQHNPYQNYEGESSPSRERRGSRDDRGRSGAGRGPDSRGRDSQRPPQNRGPRPEGGRSAGPRSSGPRRDQGGGQGRPNHRPERDERPERPPEILPALEVLFQPEPHGAESMVKQIKSSGRAYPVFELARMILKKPERHQVVLQIPANPAPDEPQQLFVCKTDQSLWLSEADAVQHILQKHLGRFYQSERVATEAPKGNFTCIGVCGMSGTVLGPPNHHDYPAAVRRLYLDRFSNLPFEGYKSRIQLVKDEAVLTKWKDQQSWKTEYLVKTESPAPAALPTETAIVPGIEAAAAEEAPAATATSPSETISQTAPSDAEPVSAPSESVEAPQEISATETLPETNEATAEPAAEPSAAEPTSAPSAVRLPNLDAVRAHFSQEYQASQIEVVRSRVLGDLNSRHQSDPLIQKVIRRAWDSEVRFPAKTGPALIHGLSKNGLQFFKWNKGITHVAAVRPKRFDAAKSPVAEGVSKILEWIATHPKKTRVDLLNALAPEPVAAPASPSPTPAPAPSPTAAVRPVAVPTTAPVVETPAPESAAVNASSVLSDLHWLLHEGYVVEFANNHLDLLRQVEKPAATPAPVPASAAASPAPTLPEIPVAAPKPESAETPPVPIPPAS